jgi:glyoxylase-like metal-dependent hydrolase (beta-lactamase superfamily II)
MTGSPRAPVVVGAGGPVVVTGVAQQRAWQTHELPPVEQVTPGVWSVPVTMPENPLRYTLTYLVLSDTGAVVVDPGWKSDRGWEDLTRGLRVAGLTPDRVTGIVVTHVHLDHHGLSQRLSEASGAWIAMHAEEVQNLPSRIGEMIGGSDGARSWLIQSGVSDDVIADLTAQHAGAADLFRLAEPDVLLNDGDHLDLPGRRIRVVWTPGHTPGHICLHDADYDLLLTGDHLLPRISPNIGLSPGLDSPLTSYLQSLKTMPSYDGAEALPAHEYRFRGIAARSDAIVRHHDARAREVLEVVAAADGPTLWEVTQKLTWSRGWEQITGFMRRAALAETAAHVEYLERAGQLTVRRTSEQSPGRLFAKAGPAKGNYV